MSVSWVTTFSYCTERSIATSFPSRVDATNGTRLPTRTRASRLFIASSSGVERTGTFDRDEMARSTARMSAFRSEMNRSTSPEETAESAAAGSPKEVCVLPPT